MDPNVTFGDRNRGSQVGYNSGTINNMFYDSPERQTDELLADLRITDPRHDKKRIEDSKGGLLEESYRWILEHDDYQRWLDDPQRRLLWIKGDPGKGKTMLLCGIIDKLDFATRSTGPGAEKLLSYFFCQATDDRLNSATAVLRGLIYVLVNQQRSLVSHIEKKYKHAGKAAFEDANAWIALRETFFDILKDPTLKEAYLIIDALDECVTDRPQLLKLIVESLAISSHMKWVVSSRNWPAIERLLAGLDNMALNLEVNADVVSHAVDLYIDHKVSQLVSIQDDQDLQDQVCQGLRQKANGTFLWVALAFEELHRQDDAEYEEASELLRILDQIPRDLSEVYKRMMKQINLLGGRDPDHCRTILATVATAYRPLDLCELTKLAGFKGNLTKPEAAKRLVKKCGSFLTIQDITVLFVHQSAKEYLVTDASTGIFTSGLEKVHHDIFSQSLTLMSAVLRPDMYNIHAPGIHIGQVALPDPDPLAGVRYSCIYWVDHLCDSFLHQLAHNEGDMHDYGIIHAFLKNKYLYWLEALSLSRHMREGFTAMRKLEDLRHRMGNELADLVRDASRFILSFGLMIGNTPLQAYVSALLFSPTGSAIRRLFQRNVPHWITLKPVVKEDWDSCMQTLTGHTGGVKSVAFSPDDTQLATASDDRTIKIWDAASGACTQTLEGHEDWVRSVAFSYDGMQLASASRDRTAKIWDIVSGVCIQTLRGHDGELYSIAFSRANIRVASAADDKTAKIWDTASGDCKMTLEGHTDMVGSVAFSWDDKQLASASDDRTVKIWDMDSGICTQTLEGHRDLVTSVVFLQNSEQLASASADCTVKIWDIESGVRIRTLKGHTGGLYAVALSQNSTRLATASADTTVKLFDRISGQCEQTLVGHTDWVYSVTFSQNGTRLASASNDCTAKIWDAVPLDDIQVYEKNDGKIDSMKFSQNGTRLISRSHHKTKTWDTASGKLIATDTAFKEYYTKVAFDDDDDGPTNILQDVIYNRFPPRSPTSSNTRTESLPTQSVDQYRVSPDSTWITFKGQNILWLPPENRPGEYAVFRDTVGIGTGTGRVFFIAFKENTPLVLNFEPVH